MILHTKYFEILKEFCGDYTKQIHGRALVDKINFSQKGIALALQDLEKERILQSKDVGNLRLYSLNIQYLYLKDILAMIELHQKNIFLRKHLMFDYLFKQSDNRIVGIFGSYAKNNYTKHSDIDIFVVGKRGAIDYEALGKIVNLPVSVKYFSEKEWKDLLRRKNTLMREIVANHVLIFGAERFVNMTWCDFYGFDKLVF
ncbi:MAG: nucleotidyltransferase domain-containing protein [Candidatus Woesearchaeota archaeon]